jgi:hypothetical protein
MMPATVFLADLLRPGRPAEAWIAPPQVRESREVARYRIKLVRMRSSAKDQVHAVPAKHAEGNVPETLIELDERPS